MGAGGIAFVAVKTEFRVILVVALHQAVAAHLGDNGRGGDGGAQRIAFRNRPLRQRRGDRKRPVDQQAVRPGAEVVDRHGHGEKGRLEDVDPVDFHRIDNADPHGHRVGVNPFVESVPLFRGQFLGVGEPGIREIATAA